MSESVHEVADESSDMLSAGVLRGTDSSLSKNSIAER